MRESNAAFEEGKYEEASLLLSSLGDVAEDPKVFYNLGSAYYALSQYNKAALSYSRAVSLNGAFRLWGNALKRKGDNTSESSEKQKIYEEALKAYRQAIILDEGDQRAKFNYEWVKRLLEEQKSQNKNDKQDQDKKEQDKKNQDKKDKQDQGEQKKPENQDKNSQESKDQKENSDKNQGQQKEKEDLKNNQRLMRRPPARNQKDW